MPQALSGWTSKTPLQSATKEADSAAATLKSGQAVQATLHHTREVAYVVEPDKPGGSVAYGGILAVQISKAGTYQFSLGSGAWIDVVSGASKIASTAHGHGPECSSIRKAVAFPLKPGHYIVQISANAAPTLDIMISPKL
ncbi:homogentisate 1,2-dioxygenase [Methylovirgula ligni]|uniref:homogentisate 1,2-dioxygenase n=1 Tax=Methylovirgula ligni TaxID=569860 RepID=UPI00101039F4|nr:homogentisate 1,2-dioxygenase [Methylovirgula ligni]